MPKTEMKFYCNICNKVYDDFEDAFTCEQDCLIKRNKKSCQYIIENEIGINPYRKYFWLNMNDDERQRTYEMSSEERLKVKQQEEKLRLTQAFAELCHKETQIIAANKEKDSIYLMAKAQELTEKKIDFVGRAVKNIKDEGLLKEVLARFDQIHAGFMATINQLISNSNSNFSPNKG